MRFAVLVLLVVLAFGCIQQSANSINISQNVSNFSSANISLNTSSTSQTNSTYTPNSTKPIEINSSDIILVNCSNQDLQIIYYYHYPKCSACKEVRPLIDYMKKLYGNYTCFSESDVSTKTGLEEYNDFTSKNNITARYVPAIKVGDNILTGLQEINYTSLYNALSTYTNVSVLDENNPH